MAHTFDHSSFSPSRDPARGRLPSPRLEYFDGEVPPALSPLDAFAARGRLLARELDESKRKDSRLTRLPPNVIRSLSQPRTGFYRSPSPGDAQFAPPKSPSQPTSPEVENPDFRPQSQHPQLSNNAFASKKARNNNGSAESGATTTTTTASANTNTESDLKLTPVPSLPPIHGLGDGDLGIVRTESPVQDPVLSQTARDESRRQASDAASVPTPPKVPSTESASSSYQLNVSRTLAPPGSSMSRPTTTHTDSSDEDNSSSNGGSTFSCPRKQSSSSAMSLPHSPVSAAAAAAAAAAAQPHRRTPSGNSEASLTGHGTLPRPPPNHNFSRPISRSGPHLPHPAAPASGPYGYPGPYPGLGQPKAVNRTHKPSPILVPSMSDARPASEEPQSAISSHSNSHVRLPRGRQASDNSAAQDDAHHTPPNPRQDHFPENSLIANAAALQHERSYKTSPSAPPGRFYAGGSSKADHEREPSPANDRPFTAASHSSSRDSNRPREAHRQYRPYTVAPKTDDDQLETMPSEPANTLRTQNSAPSLVPSAACTAEEHVTLGIECHEKGSLNESTYHLRIAAKQNDPTGMLLYALACRHGWGVRPNQREGVRWLRKALDCLGLEQLVGNTANNAVPTTRAQDMVQRVHRAQLALSVYELGVSHLNGWGIERDKAQALRCFEIAAQWGDADAMTEAGFCYSQGTGCKKDMKKAAKFYRMAEANGMSMVGNSWYVLLPYMILRVLIDLLNMLHLTGFTKTNT